MGRKGTSKRKPKKSKPITNTSISGDSPVQSLVRDKGVPTQSDNAKAPGGWNKKKRKH